MSLVADTPSDFAAWTRTADVLHDGGIIVHVAGAAEDLPRLASVINATADRGGFGQVLLDAGCGPATDRTLAELGAELRVHSLPVAPRVPEEVRGALGAYPCTALLVYVDDHAALCAAVAAARLGIAVVRVGGPAQCGRGRIIARLADLLLIPSPTEHPGLADWTAERVVVIGNPLVEVVERNARAALDEAAWRRYGMSPGSYVLMALSGAVAPGEVAPLLDNLVSRFPVIVEAPAGYEFPGTVPVTAPSFLQRLSLERAAQEIYTDSPRVCEEARVLGLRCHTVMEIGKAPHRGGAGGGPAGDGVTAWDRQAGARAADALVANFARVRLSQ
jgi:hypothetical protein